MSQYQYGAPPVPEPSRLGGGSHLPLLAPFLAPGEQVHGIANADLSELIRRVPRRHRKERLGRGTEAALGGFFLVFDVLAGLGEVVEDLTWGLFRSIRRLVRGRALKGGWRSRAGQFVVAVRCGHGGHDNDDVKLVFTDRRILLVDDGRRGSLIALGELGHAELRRVRDRHTWISNRVDLHFADGSLAALEVTGQDLAVLQRFGPR